MTIARIPDGPKTPNLPGLSDGAIILMNESAAFCEIFEFASRQESRHWSDDRDFLRGARATGRHFTACPSHCRAVALFLN